MKTRGNNYNSTIQVEFRDMIENLISSERKCFHIYTIHRILSLALLIDCDFRYSQIDESGKYLAIMLDLGVYGEVMFKVDMGDNCVEIANEISRKTLTDFLEGFDKCKKKDKPSLFTKVF